MKVFSNLLLVGACCGTIASSSPTKRAPAVPSPHLTNSSSPHVMFQLSTDSEFAFVLETFLSLANGGGANTGEILRAASQIKAGDFESFYSEFKFLADQIYSMGTKLDATKFPVSVRDAMFRASSYYRAADFFIHGNQSDPRIFSLWDSQTAAFDKAISLLDIPGERVNITTPHGFYIPVIFYKASNGNESRPTILVGNGYDAAQEDSYHYMCKNILARGWNCATYEGPGQPSVRRDQNLGFISQWWQAVTPVVDYLDSRCDVDMNKLALIGISFGGALAPIAASHEHRFKAVLSFDGAYNLGDYSVNKLPTKLKELFHSGNRTAFDTFLNEARNSPKTPTDLRWSINQGLFSFNTKSPFEWLTRFLAVGVNGLADQIRSPVFVGSGQDDDVLPGQAELLANALGKKAYYHLFKTNLGAGEHCQLGADAQLAQVAFDWLQGVW